ncbi:hypothetical protein BZB76_1179 [Actinomadura pelletieri DSM 43383]|uniref:CDP-glycerol:poly(Glycerophosphate) glycerophosphotransferase n=1 Tax=Actinomadura pelletieri DSM 43383 TaxID=1120940 RepID=A0A495R0G1_9ACTN|nr:hypothetical protein [Actinomadura pelletieri]RKS79704.1 hypothetical protein BZB76_1179 [Actinomadura pelletieri DSM 43383]
MSENQWRPVPIGLGAEKWATRRECKTVLVIVHTVTSGQRVLEAARLLENDLRVQVVFTQAPDVFGDGVADLLTSIGAAQVPWEQARQTKFDLAMAASLAGLHEIHAPLIVMPHGAGHNKLVVRRAGRAVGGRAAYDLDSQRLVHDGALVPTSLVLAHNEDLGHLGRSCPEAVPAAVVCGDPCFDTLVASLACRSSYQVALGAGDGRKLVVVTSTWGTKSLLGRNAELWPRLLTELPKDEFHVVTLLHPNVWYGHGTWQVRTWLADLLRRGLSLVPPEADWRAVLAAADWVIGDHGSVTAYSAVTGVPVLLGSFADRDCQPGSAQSLLAEVAPRVSKRGSLRRQLLQAAADFDGERHRTVIDRLSSEPGRFNHNMRQLIYRRLRLRVPATVPVTLPAVPPYLAK